MRIIREIVKMRERYEKKTSIDRISTPLGYKVNKEVISRLLLAFLD